MPHHHCVKDWLARVPTVAVQALDAVSPARLLVALLITLLLVLHGLVPRNFQVDGTSLGLLGILVVLIFVPLLESATLPGGGGLAFRKRIEQLERVVGDVEHESVEAGSSAPVTLAITAAGTVSTSLSDQPTATEGLGVAVEAVHIRTLPATTGLSTAIVGQVLEATSRSPKLGLMRKRTVRLPSPSSTQPLEKLGVFPGEARS